MDAKQTNETLSAAVAEYEAKRLERLRLMVAEQIVKPLVDSMIEDGILPELETPFEVSWKDLDHD